MPLATQGRFELPDGFPSAVFKTAAINQTLPLCQIPAGTATGTVVLAAAEVERLANRVIGGIAR